MNYLPEVLKILDGALRSNVELATNYARLLAEKLQADGQPQQAKLLLKKLESTPSRLVPMNSGGLGAVPVDQESHLDLAETAVIGIDAAPLLLEDYLQQDVQRFLSNIRHTNALMAAGLDASARMLVYGPPGVGKTHLARYIAGQLQLPLITARCDSLISSYLGSTSKNIRRLFDHAVERPCVLFLDEFDALAKARDDSQELGELKRVVVSLLQNIDALPPQSVLIAASNHEQLLDPAVWRRFNFRLEIRLPSAAIREALLKSFLGPYAPTTCLQHAIDLTAGMSGGLIRHAVEDCVREAVIHQHQMVSEAKLVTRLAQIVLNSRKAEPSPEGVADLLIESGMPLRAVSEGTHLSMRQLLKRSGGRAKATNNKKGLTNAKQGKSSSSARTRSKGA